MPVKPPSIQPIPYGAIGDLVRHARARCTVYHRHRQGALQLVRGNLELDEAMSWKDKPRRGYRRVVIARVGERLYRLEDGSWDTGMGGEWRPIEVGRSKRRAA